MMPRKASRSKAKITKHSQNVVPASTAYLQQPVRHAAVKTPLYEPVSFEPGRQWRSCFRKRPSNRFPNVSQPLLEVGDDVPRVFQADRQADQFVDYA